MSTNAKQWLITGVSSGLGRATAQAALAAGHRVVGTVRRREQLKQFEELSYGRASAVLMDVMQPASVAAGVEAAAKAAGGRFDVLVNNAGSGLVGAIEETDDAEAQDVFEANFFGQLRVTRALLPFMRSQLGGHIVAASAVAGFTGFAGFGVYSAAKAAVDACCEALAHEVAPFGIKVTVLTIGMFRTRFIANCRKTRTRWPAYAHTPAGKFRDYIDQLDGRQLNDPIKAAQAIVRVVDSWNPPLHLALGGDAVAVMRRRIERVQQDLAEWETLGASTAFATPCVDHSSADPEQDGPNAIH
jgi:NAD(P)-dependent dehydrogenase (short-subunit alcohol dehydrogenase family)